MGGALRLLAVPTDAPVDNVVLPPPGADVKEGERRRRARRTS